MTHDTYAPDDSKADTGQSTEFAGSDMPTPTNEKVPAPLNKDNDTGTEAITPEDQPTDESGDDASLNDKDLDADDVDDTPDDSVDDSIDQSAIEPGLLAD